MIHRRFSGLMLLTVIYLVTGVVILLGLLDELAGKRGERGVGHGEIL